MSEHLAVQSLCDHLSVHDRDVHEEKQDHKEIVHESQEAEECLGDDVEWRGQVGERSHQAEKNSDPEHPEEAAHWEHLSEGVAEQGGHISQPVHKLRRERGEKILLQVLNNTVLLRHNDYYSGTLLLQR